MKKRVRQGDPQREQQWRAVLRQWQTSGQSVRDYCRAQGLKESAFYFWRRELARRGPAGAQQQEAEGRQPPGNPSHRERAAASLRRTARARQEQARFLPVQVVRDRDHAAHGARATAGGIEIVVRDGHLVRVQPGFDRQMLAEVLRVLEAQPC